MPGRIFTAGGNLRHRERALRFASEHDESLLECGGCRGTRSSNEDKDERTRKNCPSAVNQPLPTLFRSCELFAFVVRGNFNSLAIYFAGKLASLREDVLSRLAILIAGLSSSVAVGHRRSLNVKPRKPRTAARNSSSRDRVLRADRTRG